jgi:hypothetical protein
MPDDDAKARAARLRDRIREKREDTETPDTAEPDSGPRPGESPNAYVERRMRETLKKETP